MVRPSRKEMLKSLVDYFHANGKVLLRSEYISLGDKTPIPYRMFNRYFGGSGYNTVMKMARKAYPVDWASIGTTLVEETPAPKPAPAPKKPAKVVKEPAKESDLTPLEKLRATKGESSE